MNIEISRATRHDTPVLRHLYELYSYDFSVYTRVDVDPAGRYTDNAFLTDYWRNPRWSGYLVRADGNLAGFAWVLETTLFRPDDVQALDLDKETDEETWFLGDEPHHLIEEFFVMRKYRLKGIGEYVACHLFDLFPGIWEVSEMVENTPAQAFWRKVIDRYTGGQFVEVDLDTELWHGPVQVLRSATKDPGPTTKDK
jgi:predicted acetyltransferase